VEFPDQTEGYLLARKDMCLLPHVPALVRNGIASLKIEGRMRTGEFLAPIVALYRNAVDAYFDDPVNYVMSAADTEEIFSRRVREYTTAHTFSNPGSDGIDLSGRREPRFFSYNSPEPKFTVVQDVDTQPLETNLELIVHVAGSAAAETAIQAGADAVYLCGEGFVLHDGSFTFNWLQDFAKKALENNVRVAVTMPHVCDLRDMAEWQHWIARLSSIGNLGISVTNLGGIQIARANNFREIIAAFPLNITNSIAADELSTMGTTRITASVELNLERLRGLMKTVRMPVEVIGQGPVTAMLLEHCVLASAAGVNPQGICPRYCHKGVYALQDASGHDFALECDRRCRNHVFTATDVCVLPNLSKIASTGISGLRIEGQLDCPSTVEIITRVYRKTIDTLKAGGLLSIASELEEIENATGRALGDGPFDFQTVTAGTKEQNLVTT
jgi:putative protease